MGGGAIGKDILSLGIMDNSYGRSKRSFDNGKMS